MVVLRSSRSRDERTSRKSDVQKSPAAPLKKPRRVSFAPLPEKHVASRMPRRRRAGDCKRTDPLLEFCQEGFVLRKPFYHAPIISQESMEEDQKIEAEPVPPPSPNLWGFPCNNAVVINGVESSSAYDVCKLVECVEEEAKNDALARDTVATPELPRCFSPELSALQEVHIGALSVLSEANDTFARTAHEVSMLEICAARGGQEVLSWSDLNFLSVMLGFYELPEFTYSLYFLCTMNERPTEEFEEHSQTLVLGNVVASFNNQSPLDKYNNVAPCQQPVDDETSTENDVTEDIRTFVCNRGHDWTLAQL